MKKKRPKYVEITFLDHSMHRGDEQTDPCLCIAVGEVVYEDESVMRICTWVADGAYDSADAEYFTIVKRPPILKVRRLK